MIPFILRNPKREGEDIKTEEQKKQQQPAGQQNVNNANANQANNQQNQANNAQSFDHEIRNIQRKQQIERSEQTRVNNQPKNTADVKATNQQAGHQERKAENQQGNNTEKEKQQEEKKTWFKLVNKSSVPISYMLVNATNNTIIKSGTLNPGQSFEENNVNPSTLELKVYVTNSMKPIKNPSGEIVITNEWISKNLTEYFGNVCVENDSSLPLTLSYYALNYGASKMTKLDPGQKQCIVMYKEKGWVAVAVGANGSIHNLASVDQTPKHGETVNLKVTDKDIIKVLGLKDRPASLYTNNNGLCEVYAVYTDGKIKLYEWPTWSGGCCGETTYDLTRCDNPVPVDLAVKYFLGNGTYKLVYRNGSYTVKDKQIVNPQTATY